VKASLGLDAYSVRPRRPGKRARSRTGKAAYDASCRSMPISPSAARRTCAPSPPKWTPLRISASDSWRRLKRSPRCCSNAECHQRHRAPEGRIFGSASISVRDPAG